MADQELMARALEFLEDNQHHIADNERHAYVMLYNDCITALKARLAQETALQALHNENKRLGLYKDAYAEPEQEPVAILNHAHGVHTFRNVKLKGLPDGEYLVFTHPPQRTEQEPTPEIKYKMIVIDDLHPQGIPVEQWVNQAQRTEHNFCSRCGKRTADSITIHTCTPPKENT
jgi:hypothetical protein